MLPVLVIPVIVKPVTALLNVNVNVVAEVPVYLPLLVRRLLVMVTVGLEVFITTPVNAVEAVEVTVPFL